MLTISYDGTNYSGWQRQENALSIQEVIEEACQALFQVETPLLGAGRTDAKVHALGQVATIQVDTNIPIWRLPYALNTYLPPDIVIVKAEEKPLEFHPRYDAKNKTYRYQIENSPFPTPQLRNYTKFVYQPLDIEKMKEAGQYFCGTHDFKGFCSARTATATTVRTIYDLQITKCHDLITIEITGNGFLYHMVRIIAGALINIGRGKIPPKEIPDIILSKDRVRAGKTAAPQGLTLMKIEY